MKTIQEMIAIMQHYANGGEIESKTTGATMGKWDLINSPLWDWRTNDYRIKQQKKIVTIEKWLVGFGDGEYRIVQTSDINKVLATKIKLLETYKVEL